MGHWGRDYIRVILGSGVAQIPFRLRKTGDISDILKPPGANLSRDLSYLSTFVISMKSLTLLYLVSGLFLAIDNLSDHAM